MTVLPLTYHKKGLLLLNNCSDQTKNHCNYKAASNDNSCDQGVIYTSHIFPNTNEHKFCNDNCSQNEYDHIDDDHFKCDIHSTKVIRQRTMPHSHNIKPNNYGAIYSNLEKYIYSKEFNGVFIFHLTYQEVEPRQKLIDQSSKMSGKSLSFIGYKSHQYK